MASTKRDWLLQGIQILARQGAPALTIERLLDHMNLSKGSFYHHFGSFAGYKTALLELYEREGTQQIIDDVEQEPQTEHKLKRLFTIIAGSPLYTEVAIRAWSRQDAEVAAVQEQVDKERMAYVESLCRQNGVAAKDATLIAQTLYAILIGCEQMHPLIDSDRFQKIIFTYLKAHKLA